MGSQWRARDPASASDTPERTLHRYLPVRKPLSRLIPEWTGSREAIPYITALSGIAGVTLLLIPFRSLIHPTVFPLSYLVLVSLSRGRGMGAAIFASLGSAVRSRTRFSSSTCAFRKASCSWPRSSVYRIERTMRKTVPLR